MPTGTDVGFLPGQSVGDRAAVNGHHPHRASGAVHHGQVNAAKGVQENVTNGGADYHAFVHGQAGRFRGHGHLAAAAGVDIGAVVCGDAVAGDHDISILGL